MKADGENSLPEDERIEKEAADWVAHFDRGLTASEQDAFFEWLAADPRHGEVFAEDQREWRSFDALDQWRPEYSKEANPDLLKKAAGTPFWKKKRFRYATAASVMFGGLALFLATWLADDRTEYLAEGDFATSYERHVLGDGTVVELNAGAQVAVLFSKEERRIELTSGEAHFSVASEAARPFVVSAHDTEVRAIGTAFSVRLTSETLEVLVTEGKVRMQEPNRYSSRKTVSQSPIQSARATDLIAGQRAVQPLVQEIFAPQVFTVTVNELESRLAWKDQILDYNSRPLSEVVQEFNRHNYTQIVIGDEELNEMKVTIALKPDNYEGFVRLLELSAGIETEETEYGTIVLKKRR